MNNSMGEVITQIVENYVWGNVQTAIPARIVSIKGFEEGQTVAVQPLINTVDKDGVVMEIPLLYDVPIMFPSAGGGILSFPVTEGDTVLLVFSSRSIDDFVEASVDPKTDYTITPTDNRRYNYTDAIAIPGLYPKANALKPNPTDVELKFADSSVSIKPNGDMALNATGNINMTATGIITITGAAVNINP